MEGHFDCKLFLRKFVALVQSHQTLKHLSALNLKSFRGRDVCIVPSLPPHSVKYWQ